MEPTDHPYKLRSTQCDLCVGACVLVIGARTRVWLSRMVGRTWAAASVGPRARESHVVRTVSGE